jgi:hypothetical protein
VGDKKIIREIKLNPRQTQPHNSLAHRCPATTGLARLRPPRRSRPPAPGPQPRGGGAAGALASLAQSSRQARLLQQPAARPPRVLRSLSSSRRCSDVAPATQCAAALAAQCLAPGAPRQRLTLQDCLTPSSVLLHLGQKSSAEIFQKKSSLNLRHVAKGKNQNTKIPLDTSRT